MRRVKPDHTWVFGTSLLKILYSIFQKQKDNVIFVLWGKKAQAYAKYIKGNNKIVTAPHPAADAYTGGRAGFHTSGTFRNINSFLSDPIKWNSNCGEPLPKELNEAPFLIMAKQLARIIKECGHRGKVGHIYEVIEKNQRWI